LLDILKYCILAKMNTFEDLIGKLKSLPLLVKATMDGTINNNADNIADMNRAQMLVLGVDADGIELGEYAAFTIKQRQERGLQTDYIDLRFTGDFQNSIGLNKIGDTFELGASDVKWEDSISGLNLSERWPAAIGLTDDNEDRITAVIEHNTDLEVDKYLDVSTNSDVPAFA